MLLVTALLLLVRFDRDTAIGFHHKRAGHSNLEMKVAVVGSGISGLSASWLLSDDHEVHVFEREAKLGKLMTSSHRQSTSCRVSFFIWLCALYSYVKIRY
jgi:heterodisulfide reductase subunit A-like polyferredoxin